MAEAERSVSVVLRADIQDYVAKMGAASRATKDFASQTGKISGSASTATKNLGASAKSASTDLDNAAKSTKGFGDTAGKAGTDVAKVSRATQDASSASSTLGLGMAAAGAAVAAGIGLAVKAFADFDKEMSNVRAVSGATAGQMLQLKDAALEAGAATKFSASDAASAEAELVKAGISVKDVLGGALLGSLNLAAAGNLDLANAATISAQAMNIFKLEGKDVGHIADVLAAGANKSAADIGQLGDALRQGGLVASQTGLSLEETTGVLSAFADNALIGSDAGTSLKTMLQRLVPQSEQAAQAMKDIGFSAYNAQGQFVGISSVAQQLQKGLAGLTQQQRDSTLATIFGSDAVRSANVLYKLGSAGVKDYTTAVNDSGAASRVAAIQMDNLAGDIEQLRGSFETALIQSGSGANDALRGIAQSATSLVNAFGELPDSVQSSVIGLAALTSGVLLLGGGLATVVPKIVATKAALDALSVSAPRAAGALGLLSKAVAVIAVADVATQIRGMAAASQVGEPAVSELADSLLKVAENGKDAGKFGDLFARGAGPFRQTFEDASAALTDFGANANAATNSTWYETLFGTGAEAQSIFETRVKQIDKALVELVNSGHGDQAAKLVDRLADSTTQFGGDANKVRDAFTGYKAAVEGGAVANGQYADSVDGVTSSTSGAVGPGKLLGDQIKEQKKAAEDAQKAYDDLTKSVKGYGNELSGALSATSKYEASVDQAADRVQKRAEIQSQISKLQKADAKGNADEIARLQDQLKDYAATLDLGSEAGRANTESLLAMAQGAKDAAVANSENGVAMADVRSQFDRSRQTFIDQAIAFGATKDQARAMADQLGLTQTNLDKLATAADVKKTVTADTAQADTNLHSITRQLEQIDATNATATVTVTYERVGPSVEAIAGLADGSLGFKGFDGGGWTGPGGKYQPAGVVHADEFVFSKEATNKAGVANLDALHRQLRGYASGGLVQPRFASAGSVSSAITNSGGNVTNDRRINIENVNAADFQSFEREAERRRRLNSLGTRRAR